MPLPDGLTPTKVVGVHLNYRSRAEQRGRMPTEPSYFLKPPSSISDGGPVVRPQGTELLASEGEIAVIIGTSVRNATLEDAQRAIGWYAPANDFGVHDFRWAIAARTSSRRDRTATRRSALPWPPPPSIPRRCG